MPQFLNYFREIVVTKILAFMLSSFLFLTVCSSVATASEPFKMGIFHSSRFLDETNEGKIALQKINLYIEKGQKEIEAANLAIQQSKAELDKIAPTLSPSALQIKINQLQKKAVDLDAMTSAYQNKLNQMYQHARMTILDKAQSIVANYARENGYSMIQDASTVFYAESEYILTDILIRLYNDKY